MNGMQGMGGGMGMGVGVGMGNGMGMQRPGMMGQGQPLQNGMGGAMVGGMAGGMGGGMGPALTQQHAIQKHILAKLREREPLLPPGWWSVQNLNIRLNNIFQLTTQLRLLKPGTNLDEIINIAVSFEMKKLIDSNDQAHYESMMREKMSEIHQNREKQAQGMEQQLQNPRMNMNLAQQRGMPNAMFDQRFNQPGAGFPNQQMQRPMPPSAMPMMQQPQQQEPRPGMMGNTMPANQNQMQMPLGGAQTGIQQLAQNFTPEEVQVISNLGIQLLQRASPQERQIVQARLASNPQQTMMLQSRGIDPMQWSFRQVALRQYVMNRRRQQAQQQGNLGPGGNVGRQQTQTQNLVNGQGQQIGLGQSNFSSQPFGGNLQQIMGLQESAIREQEAGRMVVPASQQQRMSAQPGSNQQQNPLNGGVQRQQFQGQAMMPQNPRMTPQQNQFQLQNSQSQRMQQGNLTGQAGGLGGTMGQVPPQQSPAMPNLNQPMHTGMPRPPSQNAPQQKPQPHKTGPVTTSGQPNLSNSQPNISQQHQAQLSQQGQNINSARGNVPGSRPPGMPPLPPQIMKAYMDTPNEKKPEFMRQFQERIRQQQMNRSSTQPSQGQQSSGLPNNFGLPFNFPPNSRPTHLTAEQKAEMDGKAFPKPILNQNAMMQHLPPEITTWGELIAWCRSQKHVLPGEVIGKVEQLQGMHWEQLRKQEMSRADQNSRQNMVGQPTGDQAVSGPTLAQGGPVPQAPTTGQPKNMNTMADFLAMLPQQLGPQHLQTLKVRVPFFNNMNNEQISTFIAQKRQSLQAQQPQQQASVSAQGNRGQPNKPQASQPQQAQSKAIVGGPVQQQAQVQESRMPNQSSTQRGVKRQGEEILEKPATTAPTQTSNAPASKLSQSMQKSPSSQGAKGVQGQVKPQPVQDQVAQQQSSPNVGTLNIEPQKMQIYRATWTEMKQVYANRVPIEMDAATHQEMNTLLAKEAPFIQRSAVGALHYFHLVDSNPNHLREIFRAHEALASQFRDGKFKELKEQFSITLKEAKEAMGKIRAVFFTVTRKKRETIGSESSSAQNPGANKTQPAKTAEAKLQAQQPQKVKKEEKEPPAPTTEKAPFPFGSSPPPHGIPIYDKNLTEVTQDKLVLPENKRRKTATQTATKVQSQASTPQPTKQVAPPPRQEPAFKCPIQGCEHSRKGFQTGEQLAQHYEQAHKEKDPDDALAFALEQARTALNLDASGKSIPRPVKMEKSLSAQPMKRSASTQGPTPKMEGGTPMSRGTTHLSNLGAPRTPQSMVKGTETRPTPKSTPNKQENIHSKEPLTPEAWTNLSTTPQQLAERFPNIEAIQGAMDWTSLTPASTLATSKSAQSTPKSDIVTSDVVKIKSENEDWIPQAFYRDCYTMSVDTSFANDDIFSMDWEEAFPTDPEASKKRKKKDPNGGFRPDAWAVRTGAGFGI